MKTIFLIGWMLISISLLGQNSWVDLISSSNNIHEIQEAAGHFFSEKGKGKGSGFKQYQRWIGQAQMHVNRDGILKNRSALAFKGLKERQKNFKSTSRSTNGNWANLGPFDYFGGDVYSGGGLGRINCMGFHPTNPSIFYAGAPAGGLWKTTDNGINWTPLTDGLPSLGVSEIIVHQTNPNIIYMLTGDGDGNDTPGIGVLKSPDAGVSWSETSFNFTVDQPKNGYRMVAHPDNPNVMIVGMTDGIYRTNDGFNSFNIIEDSLIVYDIEFAPNHPDTVYAATNKGLYISSNAGLSFNLKVDSIFPTSNARMAIAISPSNSSSLYVIFGGQTAAGTFQGIFKSPDYGNTFNIQANSPNILDNSLDGSNAANQAIYDLTILVHPENDATVFVGGINMWKSNDSGVSWGRETWWTKNYEPSDPYVHADWHNMYYQGGYLYACMDGGISRSNDEGNDWSEISKNLCIMQFYEIALNGNQYMGGAQDNGTNRTEFDNQTSHSILGGDGFGCTWHYGNTEIQYLTTQSSVVRRQGESNVFIWNLASGFWFAILKMHTTDPDYFFVTQDNQLYRASQNAAIWDFNWEPLGTDAFLPLFPFTSGKEIFGYSQGEGANDNVMYLLGTNNIILKTSNLAATSPTWEIIADPTPTDAVLSDIIQKPTDEDMVWMTCSGYVSDSKVWSSPDGGSSWTNITDNLPNVPVLSITYDEGSGGGIYIGTSIGIFYRSLSMTEWSYFGNGLPNVPVSDLKVHEGFLYAGTYGRGMWRTTAFSPCPFNLTLTPANDPMIPGTMVHNVSNNITSTRIIENHFGMDITYTSENSIDLLPGFIAKTGIGFLANVDDCPD